MSPDPDPDPGPAHAPINRIERNQTKTRHRYGSTAVNNNPRGQSHDGHFCGGYRTNQYSNQVL